MNETKLSGHMGQLPQEAPIIASTGGGARFVPNDAVFLSGDLGMCFSQLQFVLEVMKAGTAAWAIKGYLGREGVRKYKTQLLEELNWAYISFGYVRNPPEYVRDILKLIDTYGKNNRSLDSHSEFNDLKFQRDIMPFMRNIIYTADQVNRAGGIIEDPEVRKKAEDLVTGA